MRAFLVISDEAHEQEADAAFSLLKGAGMQVVELAGGALQRLASIHEAPQPAKARSGTQMRAVTAGQNGDARPLSSGHVRHS